MVSQIRHFSEFKRVGRQLKLLPLLDRRQRDVAGRKSEDQRNAAEELDRD
jgi:hypothetical protein